MPNVRMDFCKTVFDIMRNRQGLEISKDNIEQIRDYLQKRHKTQVGQNYAVTDLNGLSELLIG